MASTQANISYVQTMRYRPTGLLVVSQKATQHLFKVQTQCDYSGLQAGLPQGDLKQSRFRTPDARQPEVRPFPF